jgi:NADPH:quinone reductase-like Zn-dependent oxidoreductase
MQQVFSASTDYRDLRKAAYQEFVVAADYNVCRVPDNVPKQRLAGLGVAFVAATLALGVCLGSDFSQIQGSSSGPNLLGILKSLDAKSIPEDVREECLEGIPQSDIPRSRDWIAIWGGSSATAQILAQLAKLVGLRVIKIVDVGKHGEQLSQGQTDLLVDNHDPKRAVEIIRRVTKNRLRFGVDTIGKKTAELLREALQNDGDGVQSHLVGFSGLPSASIPGIKHHTVPIKVHHDVQAVGEGLMTWLEELVKNGNIQPLETELAPGGLEGINNALDRMRKGEISGKRLAVKLE